MPDVAYGYCWCTCGGETRIALRTNREFGHVKGQPIRYIVGHNNSGALEIEYAKEDRGYVSSCWIWQGFVGKNGYALKQLAKYRSLAHRWYYEREYGPIPTGKQVHHLCVVRRCVNPDHLLAVSKEEHDTIHALLRVERQSIALGLPGSCIREALERYIRSL